METNEFLQKIEDARIAEAIRLAEEKTTGELRVFISHRPETSAVEAAQKHFTRLKMDRTKARNAVLIFVAPKSQQFAVIGDVAVHEKCGQPFWEKLADDLGQHFKQADFTGGLVHAIEMAGRLLREHFPADGPNPNELSDDVIRD